VTSTIIVIALRVAAIAAVIGTIVARIRSLRRKSGQARVETPEREIE
jgi:hypothetical protein